MGGDGQVCFAQGIKYQNALLLRQGIIVGQGGQYSDGVLGLVRNQLVHPGFFHRLEGVLAEYALGYRQVLDVVDTLLGAAADLREGGEEGELLFAAGVEQGAELCADVAPKGGVCLFINVGDSCVNALGNDPMHGIVGLLRGHMPGFGIYHQDVHILNILTPFGDGIGNNSGFGPVRGKLNTGIQGAGKVVCNHQ